MTFWIWLGAAGVLEICWAVGLKYTEGFTKTGASVATVILMLASFWCLAQAVKGLPLGTSYAIWTGIGAVGTAIAGIVLFKEPATAARLACIALIVAGIIGLKERWVSGARAPGAGAAGGGAAPPPHPRPPPAPPHPSLEGIKSSLAGIPS
jgi:quaternary ammonium compound-resistance protein SugE